MSTLTQKETWQRCELYYSGGCNIQTKTACDECKANVWMHHPDYKKNLGKF